METIRPTTVHDSESKSMCSALTCTNAQDIDEISKEKEDELLYGAGVEEDADEEDALSDDSLRLRLSDDDELDPEEEENIPTTSNRRQEDKDITKEEKKQERNLDVNVNENRRCSTPLDSKQEKNELKSDERLATNDNSRESFRELSDGAEIQETHSDVSKPCTNTTMRNSNNINCQIPSPRADARWRFQTQFRARPFYMPNRFPHPPPRHYYNTNSYFPPELEGYNNRFHNPHYYPPRGGNGGRGGFNRYSDNYNNRVFPSFKTERNENHIQPNNRVKEKLRKQEGDKEGEKESRKKDDLSKEKCEIVVDETAKLEAGENGDESAGKEKEESDVLANDLNARDNADNETEIEEINENDVETHHVTDHPEETLCEDQSPDKSLPEEREAEEAEEQVRKVNEEHSEARDENLGELESEELEKEEDGGDREIAETDHRERLLESKEQPQEELEVMKERKEAEMEEEKEVEMEDLNITEIEEEKLLELEEDDEEKAESEAQASESLEKVSEGIVIPSREARVSEEGSDKIEDSSITIDEHNITVEEKADDDGNDTEQETSENLSPSPDKEEEEELEMVMEVEDPQVEENVEKSEDSTSNKLAIDIEDIVDSSETELIEETIVVEKVVEKGKHEEEGRVDEDIAAEEIPGGSLKLDESSKDEAADFEKDETEGVKEGPENVELEQTREKWSEVEESGSVVDEFSGSNDATSLDKVPIEKPIESQDSEKVESKDNSKPEEAATEHAKEHSSLKDKVVVESNGSVISTDENSSSVKSEPSEVAESEKVVKRRRRTKRLSDVTLTDDLGKESSRQKRRTAKTAEEIIRNKFLNNDSDLESSDSSDKFVSVNYTKMNDARAASPPSLKRTLSDDIIAAETNFKKVKMSPDGKKLEQSSEQDSTSSDSVKTLSYVRRFFRRDLNDKLAKLKQEDLEELLIQKIVETITMRGEIGRLREQVRISERNQEATRTRCQQLAKQIKDFEMVLTRNAVDRRANADRPIAPIKINRSVGLQVNFTSVDHSIQNLRQLHHSMASKNSVMMNGANSTYNNTDTSNFNQRRGLKVRSPRRTEPPQSVLASALSSSPKSGQLPLQNPQIPQIPQIPPQIPQIPANNSHHHGPITPAALVVAKPVDPGHNLSLPTSIANVQHVPTVPSNVHYTVTAQPQAVVLNGALQNQASRQNATITIQKHARATSDLIDLTDEEEKSKTVVTPTITTTATIDPQVNAHLTKSQQQQCYQRVIQALPANVSLSNQTTSIRVVQPAGGTPTPTAIVNNMSAPRVTYVMPGGIGPARQLLITSNPSQIRPSNANNRTSFSTIAYKTGISTVANGGVRVLATPAAPNAQPMKQHPASLPDCPNYGHNPVWKLPPPAPSLKISKVAHGIVLSWNMAISDKHADIASYQLYAYQEVAGTNPSTTLWKKVGDVRALPLPMACTLTQFSEGNNYYFAVRAVDTHSRLGQYSVPVSVPLGTKSNGQFQKACPQLAVDVQRPIEARLFNA